MMSFKYWKKRIAIWDSNREVMAFLRLLIFTDLQLSIDRALQKLNSNFLQLRNSKLNLNQTLSKSKPRPNVLIMVRQYIQIEVLIH